MCPNCKKQIGWRDNIPLLSFILLRGRCRNCKKKISLRYPLTEIFTAAGFLLVGIYFYPNLLAILYSLCIYLILVTIFVIDLEHQIIPDMFVFVGIAISFLYLLLFSDINSLFSCLLAGFAAALFLLLVHFITRGRGMGLGDVKFAILGGMVVGPRLAFVWLILAFLTGGVAGIILILSGRAGLKTKIAFGPFLVFAILLAFAFGNQYLRFLGF